MNTNSCHQHNSSTIESTIIIGHTRPAATAEKERERERKGKERINEREEERKGCLLDELDALLFVDILSDKFSGELKRGYL